MARQVKPATTAAQQIALLRSRGMAVDDAIAQQWLANVSYYRLSAYWYPARIQDNLGRRRDEFAAGTSFADVVALYEADRKLRTMVHDGMERIEIAMRTRVGELLCADGPLSYRSPEQFRPSFDHARWINTARRRIDRAKDNKNEAIKHYRTNYEGIPFWVLAEVLDFADVSRLYEGLTSSDQRAIAEDLGIVIDLQALTRGQQQRVKDRSPLVPWMEQLTVIRNTCAHHGRLWNKSFAPAPTSAIRTLDQFKELPNNQSERVFGALTMMSHLLAVVSPGTTWPTKVAELLTSAFVSNPLVVPSGLGLPERWNGGLG